MTVGMVGVGNISTQYFAALEKLPGLRLVAVTDLDMDRARQVAAEHGVEALTVDELLADERIQTILNITVPQAHTAIGRAAAANGKHVYIEKPLALDVADATDLLAAAAAAGVRVGGAPDTFLGTGIQTSKAVIDSGEIGEVIAASAFWGAPGHELWHPAPDYFYARGGGPIYDMGPYYLTALVTLLGPVVSVVGHTRRSARTRVIESGPRAGESVPVEVDTYVSALLEHSSGVTSTVTVSYDVWATRRNNIEVYGTRGALAVPDPNNFSDPVEVCTDTERTWRPVPASHGYPDAGRAFGLADMAQAIRTDRPHRASGDLMLHVLELMEAITASGDGAGVVAIESTVRVPDAVPAGALPHTW